MKKTFSIKGMHCNSCAGLIENALKDKVKSVKVSYIKERAEIDFDEEKISEEEIKKIIIEKGYEADIESKKEDENNSDKPKKSLSDKIGYGVLLALLGVLIYLAYGFIEKFNVAIPSLGDKGSLLLLFFAGILTGFHCVSMCGAFVVSYTTKNALKGHKSFKQHLVYGGSKLFSYGLIGGIFGLIGGIFAFSVGLRGLVAVFAGLFMIFYGLGMSGIKFFKRFQINPRFLTRATAKASEHAEGFYRAPLITGLLSGLFIACGPLQAMYLYAAGTGSFITGALSLTAFGLGTLPVMLGFGSMATVISHKTTRRILKISAILVIILGIIMLNRGLTFLGSPVSFESIRSSIGPSSTGASSVVSGGSQVIKMEVDKYGWKPDSFVLKKGVPVRWEINVKELTGCNNEIIVRDYGLDIKLKKGMNVVEFTPDKAGTVRWSCWMGMIPGSFIVTDNGKATDSQIESATPVSAGGCGCGGGSSGTCGG